jgi:hypothetical protein
MCRANFGNHSPRRSGETLQKNSLKKHDKANTSFTVKILLIKILQHRDSHCGTAVEKHYPIPATSDMVYVYVNFTGKTHATSNITVTYLKQVCFTSEKPEFSTTLS